MPTFGLELMAPESSWMNRKTIRERNAERDYFIYFIYKLGLIKNWPVIMVVYE